MTANIIQIFDSFDSSPVNFVDAGSLLYFTTVDGEQLWSTDGTSAGTINLLDTAVNPNIPDENFSFNFFQDSPNGGAVGIDGRLFFSASGEQNGTELYLSNGATGETQLLRDTDPEGSGNPTNFVDIDGRLFFTVRDERNRNNLWVSDLTTEGTSLVRNFDVARFAENGIDGDIFFNAFDADNAANSGLYRSDGTAAGTQLIFNIPNNQSGANEVAVADNNVFLSFLGQLYVSDGTTAGTRLLNDFEESGQDISSFTAVEDKIFFTVNDPEIGVELWVSDGTEAGTRLARDIRPEETQNGTPINEGSNPANLLAVGDSLFFTADSDGDFAQELWRSDGTEEGTNLLLDFGTDEFGAGQDFVDVNGTLYFIRFGDNPGTNQIWQSDGTPEGTIPVDAEFVDENGEPLELSGADIFEFDDNLYGTGALRPNPGVNPVTGLFSISNEDNVEEQPDDNNNGGVGEQPNDGSDDLSDNTVYRFFNNDSGVHFYTASEVERDAVQELDNFNFEGASYSGADPLTGQVQAVPVYRFLNEDTGVHLYTVSEIEREAVEELDNFSFEGEAFFAYDGEVEGSIPIYRFFNVTTGAHFYTPSAAERDSVEENLPDFASEGIAYYALPLEE